MIITDKMMVELGYVQKIVDSLAQQQVFCDVFDQTVPEPTVSSIIEGVKQVRDGVKVLNLLFRLRAAKRDFGPAFLTL